jgi:hypothetical protein
LEPGSRHEEEKVTAADNIELIKTFSVEEIKNVVFSMETNTTPGPDHMPIEFFQACWSVIKEDILALFNDFYDLKLDIGRLNYGTITLIPKTEEANQIQMYRPICLLNVVYKIFTKTLLMRMEGCMDRIINKAQNAFIKGRNIMDGVMT